MSVRDTAPGSEFAGYRLDELLGDGGFGEVWRATELATGRVIALKILSGRYGSAEAERLRGDVEILAAAAVGKDAHVVAVETGGLEPRPFIVMEYVPGESLGERLERGALSVPETLRVGQAVAAALVALSRAGIIHRDLKAANVLLGADGSVKLADFGIAKIVGFDSLSAGGKLPMSLHYAAPEVWEGLAGEAADRYAYGVLLFECLTGHPPFTGTYMEVLRGHRELQPDLDALPPETPDGLRALIGDCLRKDPSERPPDNLALQRRIDAVARALAPGRPTHPPVAFGSWRLLAAHADAPWTWRAEREGARAIVEVVFGDLGLGETLRRSVKANPALVRLGAERLLGTNRLILHPDEAWPAGSEPGGPFAFWVAREDIPVPAASRRLDRGALKRAVVALIALGDAARAEGVTLDFGPDRLRLVDGTVLLLRPGIPDESGAAPDSEASARVTLAALCLPGVAPMVERAGSLDELLAALEADELVETAAAAPVRTVDLERAPRERGAISDPRPTLEPAALDRTAPFVPDTTVLRDSARARAAASATTERVSDGSTSAPYRGWHEVPAALMVTLALLVALAGVAVLANPPTASPRPSVVALDPSAPVWVRTLHDNPILPGVGMAGLRINDPESRVYETLGDTATSPVTNPNGDIAFYSISYVYNGLVFSIDTDPSSRSIISFHVLDADWNRSGATPAYQGVTIGSDRSTMTGLGDAAGVGDYWQCPASLGSTASTAYTYSYGIEFSVCNANGLVYLIDIP